jgi:hypothetical protein
LLLKATFGDSSDDFESDDMTRRVVTPHPLATDTRSKKQMVKAKHRLTMRDLFDDEAEEEKPSGLVDEESSSGEDEDEHEDDDSIVVKSSQASEASVAAPGGYLKVHRVCASPSPDLKLPPRAVALKNRKVNDTPSSCNQLPSTYEDDGFVVKSSTEAKPRRRLRQYTSSSSSEDDLAGNKENVQAHRGKKHLSVDGDSPLIKDGFTDEEDHEARKAISKAISGTNLRKHGPASVFSLAQKLLGKHLPDDYKSVVVDMCKAWVEGQRRV